MDIAAAYSQYAPVMLPFAVTLVGPDAAEDLLQDTWVRVCSSVAVGGYEDRGKLEPWLYLIMRRLAMNRWKKTGRMGVVVQVDANLPDRQSVEDMVLNRVELAGVGLAIRRLAPMEQAAISWALNHEAWSSRTPDAVKSALHRARVKLRQRAAA